MFSLWGMLFVYHLTLILCLGPDVGRCGPANQSFCDKSIVSLQTDCSFMQQQPSGSCIIHHTNSCRTYDFSSWGMEPEQVVTSLEDLDYQVFLSTYKNEKLALNVSFNSNSKDVRGLYVSLADRKYPGQEKYNTCRLFDFRKSEVQLVSAFYDCYFNIKGDHDDTKYFFMTSRGLPTNLVAKFFVGLGRGENMCDWESTVMVLEPALSKRSVIAQFSLASSSLNISRYNVMLVKQGPTTTESSVADKQSIEAKPGERSMAVVSFGNVAPGIYHLRIHPDDPGWIASDCSVTVTDAFMIPENAQLRAALSASLICGLVLLIVILTASIVYVYLKRQTVPPCASATVFLLYSYDSALHFKAVKALHQFLCEVPGLRVIFDVAEANEMEAPHHWLPTQLRHADHIVLVISAGVYEKVEKRQMPTDEYHPWGDLVTPAVYDILRLDELQKKLVKVVMYGTSETMVPTPLFTRGVTFKLPKHTGRLLHHLFGQQCHSALHCRVRHPQWPDPESERVFRKALEKLELESTI
uniref:Uncharacterized protein n=1 Tax=Amblyomma maculatum TaxID=34609 RepID=G3MLV8_AMBMU